MPTLVGHVGTGQLHPSVQLRVAKVLDEARGTLAPPAGGGLVAKAHPVAEAEVERSHDGMHRVVTPAKSVYARSQ
jgi:hypothetical protein